MIPYLFNPPEYGGGLLSGRLVNGRIESGTTYLSGKKLQWISTNSFSIGNEIFDLLQKTEIGSFKEIVAKYAEPRGPDSCAIILGSSR